MQTEASKKFRYPGVRPFSENEQHIFFGRKVDSERLYQLIRLEKLVLLYGKSGLGKSSLLNAGVLPLFIDSKDTVVFKLRFGTNTSDSLPPVANCLAKMPVAISNDAFEKLGSGLDSLWLHIKSLQYQKIKQPPTYLLVFDQFEELFTYDQEDVKQFKKQLSDLLYSKVPNHINRAISNHLKENPDFFSDSELEFLYKQPDVKVVLSIRSDRMSLLNGLSDYLPGILKVWYELKSLSQDDAIDAIVQPAKKEDDSESEYITPPFIYPPETLSKILDYLTSNGEKSIETFQLQTICQFAENLAIENEKLGPKKIIPFSIEPEKLGDLQNIFRTHYDALIGSIHPIEKQQAARLLIEDKLIIERNRVSLPEVVILNEKGIDKPLLDYLHDTHHILRSEPNTTGGISYELSHDTLVAPILAAKKEREDQEGLIRTEQQRRETIRLEKEQIENDKKERERKLQRRTISIVSLAAIIAIGAAVFGFTMYARANEDYYNLQKEKVISDNLRLEANDAIKRFKEEEKARKKAEGQVMVQKAKTYSSLGVEDLAIDALEKALDIDPTNQEAKELLAQNKSANAPK